MDFLNLRDLAKIGCRDCEGCSACCQGMGDSVVLDPLDVFRLEKGLSMNFEELLVRVCQLSLQDGVILPSMNMEGEEEKCVFLDENGRCSYHSLRPGLCRTFPLGRDYSEGKLQYFILEGACPQPGKSKVRVEKWLDREDAREEVFLEQWHEIVKNIRLSSEWLDENMLKMVNMQFLQIFFLTPYDLSGDFFEQFAIRKEMFENAGEVQG